jgi:uncharacterized protein (TIGR02466 family)
MNSKFFSSNFYAEEDISWLQPLNILSDKYIKQAIENNKKKFINGKDFCLSHHSEHLTNDSNFNKLSEFVLKRSFSFLENQGYCLKNYSLVMNDLWVQEFSKEGGGNHNTHVHSNSHVSGFYFLKCSNKTSYPVFHDPRPGKLMNQLPEKNKGEITDASETIPFFPKPGTFIFFNSYIGHEFVVDHGIEPFRFIHFNVQAIPKQLINGNFKKINDSQNNSSDSLF